MRGLTTTIYRPLDRHGWCKIAPRPELPNRIAPHYTYVYGAVCPQDGKADFLIFPSMRTNTFEYFLYELSKRYRQEDIALIVDVTTSHRSTELVVPENITLIALPPYSSQRNPIVPSEATFSKLVDNYTRTLLPQS